MFAESEGEGSGATFTLELPRFARPSRDARRRRMSRILIVEDEQHIADGLRFNLEAEGHEVASPATASGRSSGCSTSAAPTTSWSST